MYEEVSTETFYVKDFMETRRAQHVCEAIRDQKVPSMFFFGTVQQFFMSLGFYKRSPSRFFAIFNFKKALFEAQLTYLLVISALRLVRIVTEHI